MSLGLGAAYLSQATVIYEAEARVLIQKEGLFFDANRTTREDRNFLATQAEVIRSPLTVRRALKSVPISVPEDLEMDMDAVEFVLLELRTVAVAGTNVLKLSYRSGRPQEAARFV